MKTKMRARSCTQPRCILIQCTTSRSEMFYEVFSLTHTHTHTYGAMLPSLEAVLILAPLYSNVHEFIFLVSSVCLILSTAYWEREHRRDLHDVDVASGYAFFKPPPRYAAASAHMSLNGRRPQFVITGSHVLFLLTLYLRPWSQTNFWLQIAAWKVTGKAGAFCGYTACTFSQNWQLCRIQTRHWVFGSSAVYKHFTENIKGFQVHFRLVLVLFGLFEISICGMYLASAAKIGC